MTFKKFTQAARTTTIGTTPTPLLDQSFAFKFNECELTTLKYELGGQFGGPNTSLTFTVQIDGKTVLSAGPYTSAQTEDQSLSWTLNLDLTCNPNGSALISAEFLADHVEEGDAADESKDSYQANFRVKRRVAPHALQVFATSTSGDPSTPPSTCSFALVEGWLRNPQRHARPSSNVAFAGSNQMVVWEQVSDGSATAPTGALSSVWVNDVPSSPLVGEVLGEWSLAGTLLGNAPTTCSFQFVVGESTSPVLGPFDFAAVVAPEEQLATNKWLVSAELIFDVSLTQAKVLLVVQAAEFQQVVATDFFPIANPGAGERVAFDLLMINHDAAQPVTVDAVDLNVYSGTNNKNNSLLTLAAEGGGEEMKLMAGPSALNIIQPSLFDEGAYLPFRAIDGEIARGNFRVPLEVPRRVGIDFVARGVTRRGPSRQFAFIEVRLYQTDLAETVRTRTVNAPLHRLRITWQSRTGTRPGSAALNNWFSRAHITFSPLAQDPTRYGVRLHGYAGPNDPNVQRYVSDVGVLTVPVRSVRFFFSRQIPANAPARARIDLNSFSVVQVGAQAEL